VVDHVLLRPLPWPDAEHIVLMGNQYPGAGVGFSRGSGAPDYYDRLRDITVFDEQAMYTWDNASTDLGGAPLRLQTMKVTPSFFRVLGASAIVGRIFTDDEGRTGNEKRVVLGHGFWQSAFGGDRAAVGRDIRSSA
jgi:hypothetical protein